MTPELQAITALTNKLYRTIKTFTDDECIYMENSTTTRVIGKGKTLPKLTSGKSLSLSSVLHVSSLHKNLDSGILLNEVGLKTIVGDHKAVISRNGSLLGRDTSM